MTKKREQDSASVERIDAAASKRQGEDGRTLTLSTGVMLRLKKVPPILMADLATAASRLRPTPPVTYIPDLDRSEENPNDPDYQKAMNDWFSMSMIDINNAFILKGTEVVKVPKGLPGKDDADFLADMKILGRPAENDRERYLAWIKYIAAPDAEDVTAIIREVGRLSGVAESDVSEAISGFRR